MDDDDLPQTVFRRHSAMPRRAQARLPTPEEQETLPLYAKDVEPMDLTYVRRLMNDKTRKRFDELFSWPGAFTPTKAEAFTPFDTADGDRMLDIGLAEPASDTSDIGLCSAFTVVQEKPAGNVRRTIIWPRSLNDWLAEKGYVADVPLPHVSALLPAAHNETAYVSDFSSGFHQLLIPKGMRRLFRFRLADGRTVQLTRLPMGLRTSPELFFLVASTLAGDRLYCKPEAALHPAVSVTTWIDNVRLTGPAERVAAASQQFEARCRIARATLNAAETSTGSTYVFCGVQFAPGLVSVAEKTRARVAAMIPRIEDGTITIGELEAHFGRLWFCSPVLDIKVRDFWFALKIARRRIAGINSGVSTVDSLARLSASARTELLTWSRRIAANEPRAPPAPNAKAPSSAVTLFTDASGTGWGAVLIDSATQEVSITGGNWREAPDNIGPAEARAVALAVRAFAARLPRGTHIDLRVDNTSVKFAIDKGHAKSGAINAELHRIFEQLAGCTYDVSYVKSSENPADAPSRQLYTDARTG